MKENDNKIYMQYPYDCTKDNRLYDGKMHMIKPKSFKSIDINNREFIVMEYYDYTSDTTLSTLITKICDKFVNIPLDDYSYFRSYLNKYGCRDVTKIKLPNYIFLGETLCSSLVFGNLLSDRDKNNDNSFSCVEYVPVTINNLGSAKSCCFISSSVISKHGDDKRNYMFSKSSNFRLKDEFINKGIKGLQDNNNGYIYKFSIDIPEGTVGRSYSLESSGRVLKQLTVMIPGKHDYLIYFVPCLKYEDYVSFKYSNKIEIVENILDNEVDRFKAFYKCCFVKLPKIIYDADGKKIDLDVNNYGHELKKK